MFLTHSCLEVSEILFADSGNGLFWGTPLWPSTHLNPSLNIKITSNFGEWLSAVFCLGIIMVCFMWLHWKVFMMICNIDNIHFWPWCDGVIMVLRDIAWWFMLLQCLCNVWYGWKQCLIMSYMRHCWKIHLLIYHCLYLYRYDILICIYINSQSWLYFTCLKHISWLG